METNKGLPISGAQRVQIIDGPQGNAKRLVHLVLLLAQRARAWYILIVLLVREEAMGEKEGDQIIHRHMLHKLFCFGENVLKYVYSFDD